MVLEKSSGRNKTLCYGLVTSQLRRTQAAIRRAFEKENFESDSVSKTKGNVSLNMRNYANGRS